VTFKARFSSAVSFAVALTLVTVASAAAGSAFPPALEAAVAAFTQVQDYAEELVVHEMSYDGKRVQDRVYEFQWKRPDLARLAIVAGPGKGQVAVWYGGETLHAHAAGWLSFIRITLGIHDPRALSLRGDSFTRASLDAQIKRLREMEGSWHQASGPVIDGQSTTAVTLIVADPKINHNVSKEVLFFCDATHAPIRFEQYVGKELVKYGTIKHLRVNVGLTPGDFK